MPRANLNEILVFMAVVDAKNFVAGGQAMSLTGSAVSKAVMRLEDRLGTRLLNRSTGTLSLTDEGRVFYDRGSRVLAAVDDAEASLGSQAGTPLGLLRLTVPDAFERLAVLPLPRKYLEVWPGVRAEVSFTDRQADIVEEGFDLAVRIGGTNPDARLVSRAIVKYKAVLCASPAYLAERGEPPDADALAGRDCLVFSSRARKQTDRSHDDESTA